jgi:hypothetical protein
MSVVPRFFEEAAPRIVSVALRPSLDFREANLGIASREDGHTKIGIKGQLHHF